MTSDDVITGILGEGWDPEILPYFLETMKSAFIDANRYHFVRDFAKTLTFSNNPRDRLQMKEFDEMLDKKLNDFDENN